MAVRRQEHGRAETGRRRGYLGGHAESPVPNLSAWFDRRKVWYVSVKDKSTGEAAAKVVKASNSSLDVSAGASGVGVKQ